MAISVADFKLRYTEFSAVLDARVQVFLDDAELEMSETVWDTLYERGAYALAAHLLTLSDKTAAGSTGAPGTVASRSVGDVSVSFVSSGAKNKEDEYFGSTSYGLDYLRLRELIPTGALVVQ